MMRNIVFVAVMLVLGSGCLDKDGVTSEDVIRLTTCPEGAPCELVADGASRIGVLGCVPDEAGNLESSLMARFNASRGTWAGTDSKDVLEKEIQRNRCTTAELVVPRRPGELEIKTELKGFSDVEWLTLQPVALDAIEPVALPPALKPGELQVLGFRVRAVSGMPSEGTRVLARVVSVTPAASVVAFWPEDTLLEQTATTSLSLVVPSGTTEVTLEVLARPPPPLGASSLPDIVRTVQLFAQ